MKSLEEIYRDIESKRLLKYEQENLANKILYEQQEKQRFENIREREKIYEKFFVVNNSVGQSGGRGRIQQNLPPQPPTNDPPENAIMNKEGTDYILTLNGDYILTK